MPDLTLVKSTALNFLPNGEVRILGHPVESSRLSVQNALVNLLSERGRDPLYADRGTGILLEAVSGFVSTPRGAQHAANFAASDLLFFSREHDRAAPTARLRKITLLARIIGGNALELDTSFEIESGEVLSFPLETNALAAS